MIESTVSVQFQISEYRTQNQSLEYLSVQFSNIKIQKTSDFDIDERTERRKTVSISLNAKVMNGIQNLLKALRHSTKKQRSK